MHEFQTIRDYLRYALSSFGRHPIALGQGAETLWDEALALVFGTLALPPDGDARLLDARVTPEEGAQLLAVIEARVSSREPVAYLTGRAWFCGLPFFVDRRVLIPRSPLGEWLTEQAMARPELPIDRPLRFLDLCTGSGCLGIVAASVFPESTGVLVDIDPGALEVCQSNVQWHELGGTLTLVQSDGLQAVVPEQFDLIICNPPYVDAEDMAQLPPEYRHEPSLALASGEDGLAFVRSLLGTVRTYLTDQGLLALEVGNSAGALAAWLEPVLGPLSWVECARGGHGVVILSAADLDAVYSAFYGDQA
ncbi:MAG: 50S ribosomal protein L3 N(5)-glutamine methyltransferase [Litorivicinaceae bacterium]